MDYGKEVKLVRQNKTRFVLFDCRANCALICSIPSVQTCFQVYMPVTRTHTALASLTSSLCKACLHLFPLNS